LLQIVEDELDVERVGMGARLGKDFSEWAGAYSSVPIFRTSKKIDGALQLVADKFPIPRLAQQRREGVDGDQAEVTA
jgi:hypothetical protein